MRFTPVDSVFYDLFTASAKNLVEGAALLSELLDESTDRVDLALRMKKTEHRGDEITHSLVRRVNSTFVTPLDREDIYRLAAGLDDVLDFMEAAVDSVVLYGVETLPDGIGDQIDVITRATELTAEAMPRLRSMTDLQEYWIEINRLENVGDQVYRRIIADLFAGGYAALEVLKYKDVVDQLEAAIDSLEQVANTIEQIAVKES